MDNKGFFEGGGNVVPAAVGFISMANYERINAYAAFAAGAAINIAFEQALDAAGTSAKPANVRRVWYVEDVNSAAVTWKVAEASVSEGFPVVNAANFPELAGATANASQIFVELTVDEMDLPGEFTHVQSTAASLLVLGGGSYPQEEPINPLA